MPTQRLGIIMHGVTGRMGMNQHLIRSIVAIRAQGGVTLSNGDSCLPDPILIGRNAEKIAALAKAHGIERWGTDLDQALANTDDTVFFDAGTTQMRPTLLAKAIRAGKHVYCEKPIATNLNEAVEIARLAQASGLKHGAVQDKLFLPGLRKLDMLRRAGFFGRMLSVRLEFGYWVFEGDLQPIQRPSWNYRKEDGGGVILDMMCHWRYASTTCSAGESVSCIGTTHPQRWDESANRTRYRRRRRLCHGRLAATTAARGGADDMLGDARAARRPGDLPRRRHARLRRRRLDRMPGPIARDHAQAGVEPR
jgi:predicted dehydrogenase